MSTNRWKCKLCASWSHSLIWLINFKINVWFQTLIMIDSLRFKEEVTMSNVLSLGHCLPLALWVIGNYSKMTCLVLHCQEKAYVHHEQSIKFTQNVIGLILHSCRNRRRQTPLGFIETWDNLEIWRLGGWLIAAATAIWR